MLSEEEKGAAFAVFKNGEVVVDLWGGYADIEAWQPWKKTTVTNTFSLYTMVASLSLGLLHERYLQFLTLFLLVVNLNTIQVVAASYFQDFCLIAELHSSVFTNLARSCNVY